MILIKLQEDAHIVRSTRELRIGRKLIRFAQYNIVTALHIFALLVIMYIQFMYWEQTKIYFLFIYEINAFIHTFI